LEAASLEEGAIEKALEKKGVERRWKDGRGMIVMKSARGGRWHICRRKRWSRKP
jgi:hypothetical protein